MEVSSAEEHFYMLAGWNTLSTDRVSFNFAFKRVGFSTSWIRIVMIMA